MDKKSCKRLILIFIIVLVALGMIAPFMMGVWN